MIKWLVGLMLLATVAVAQEAVSERIPFVGFAFVGFDRLLQVYVVCREASDNEFICTDVQRNATFYECKKSDDGLVCSRPDEV